MKIKYLLILRIAVMVATFTMVFYGCGSSSASTRSRTPVSNIPDIDYSRIGPNDSVILAYLDQSLITRFNMSKASSTMSQINNMVTLQVVVGSDLYTSPFLQGIEYYNMPMGLEKPSFAHSTQMQIPNGTYTLHIRAQRGMGIRAGDILPFEAAFDNDAITYKIRLATDDEKRAGGIGLGNEVFVMEEVAQKKLR